MDDKNITRNALARAINTRFEVIDKWYNGHVEKIDSDILARMYWTVPQEILSNILQKPKTNKKH